MSAVLKDKDHQFTLMDGMGEMERAIVVSDDLDSTTKHQVISLATRANMHLADMHKSADDFCVCIFQCKQTHGENGWEAFAARSFPSLSLGNVRAAVRAGKMIVENFSSLDADRRKRISSLSRSALFALSSAPQEVAERVHQALEAEATQIPTAAQISEWRREAELAKAEAEQVAAKAAADIDEANERLRIAQLDAESRELERSKLEARHAQQEAMLRAANDSVIALRQELAERKRAERTPVEAIVHKLPPGVQSEAEALEAIREQIATETARRDKLKSNVETTQRTLQDVQRSLENHKQSADVLAQIQEDLSRMFQKFPAVLVTSLTTKTPAAKDALKDIAGKLRALADQISPL